MQWLIKSVNSLFIQSCMALAFWFVALIGVFFLFAAS